MQPGEHDPPSPRRIAYQHAAREQDAESRRRQAASVTREHLVLGSEMADTMQRLRRQQQEAVARARIAVARARSLRDSARAARTYL